MIKVDKYNYLAFPIENEALINQGFLLKFGAGNRFLSSTKIAPMAENAMRPTAVMHMDRLGKKKLLMIGGRADRNSMMYDLDTDSWWMTPRLPLNHNITTNICVNYRDEAIFTIISDARLTIKSAAMNLKTSTYTPEGTPNEEEMHWAFE